MILILSQDAAELAQMLDDMQLDKQIKAIAKALKIVYYRHSRHYTHLNEKNKFADWASEYRANYNKLVEIGLACCAEWCHRNTEEHKLLSVIIWSLERMPELPILTNQPDSIVDFANCFGKFDDLIGDRVMTPYPLVMPQKHIFVGERDKDLGWIEYNNSAVKSYRNYYRTLLQKRKDKKESCFVCNGNKCEYPNTEEVCFNCDGKGYIQKPIVFTRRRVPDFLADLEG